MIHRRRRSEGCLLRRGEIAYYSCHTMPIRQVDCNISIWQAAGDKICQVYLLICADINKYFISLYISIRMNVKTD